MKALKSLLWHPASLWLQRLALAGVFFVAAAGKLADPVKFLGGVAEYRLLPALLLPLVAGGLPGAELLAGLCLLLGPRWKAAAMAAALMMLVFMGAIASAMARGMELDCSCFDLLGVSSTVGWGVLGRDLLILAPALALSFAPPKAGA